MLAKIRDPENCDGKAEQWRDPITFDSYVQLIIKWLKWQEYDIPSEDALERASFSMTGYAGVWYNTVVGATGRKNRNIHSFFCFMRFKLITKISQDVIWKQYLGYHHAQLGINEPVNQYTQGWQQ